MDGLRGKWFVSLASITAVVGATIAIEDRYAGKEATKVFLSEKVDAHVVHRMQKVFILDRVHNLEDDKYLLEQKVIKSDLDHYRLEKIKNRLETLGREIYE